MRKHAAGCLLALGESLRCYHDNAQGTSISDLSKASGTRFPWSLQRTECLSHKKGMQCFIYISAQKYKRKVSATILLRCQ